MKPSRLIDVLHAWGLAVLMLLIFLILAGVPFALKC